MNLTERIKKLDKIDALVEKLAEKRESIEDEILDWIYAERMDVVKWHLPYVRAEYFAERRPKWHTLYLKINASFVTVLSKDSYGDRDVWEMELPIKHLLQPELIEPLRQERVAKAALKEAQEKENRKAWLESELAKLQSSKT